MILELDQEPKIQLNQQTCKSSVITISNPILLDIPNTPKAYHNNKPCKCRCPLCKNSKMFRNLKSLHHHITQVHGDYDTPEITKKELIKLLDQLSKAVNVGMIIQ